MNEKMSISNATLFDLIDQALHAAGSITDPRDRDESLQTVGGVMAEMDADRALEIASRITSEYFRATVTASVAGHLAGAEVDRSHSLAAQVIDLAKKDEREYDATKVEFLCNVASELAEVTPREIRTLLEDTVTRVQNRKKQDEVAAQLTYEK